jgi:hypothetical protein
VKLFGTFLIANSSSIICADEQRDPQHRQKRKEKLEEALKYRANLFPQKQTIFISYPRNLREVSKAYNVAFLPSSNLNQFDFRKRRRKKKIVEGK